MDKEFILEKILLGEDSHTQFKENIHNNNSLAEEFVAMSNCEGGIIIVGISDNGEITGLSSSDIKRLNNMISNTASDHVKPPISPITELININGKKIMVISLKNGINKPYSTNTGFYIAKSGADKRRISQEEL